MDKKDMKKVCITEVVVNTLCNYQEVTGDYQSVFDVDFVLNQNFTFHIFDKEYVIDRIKMKNAWDEVTLEYADENRSYCCFTVSKALVHKVYTRVIAEQKDGLLKGWKFDDEIIDILRRDGIKHNCCYY